MSHTRPALAAIGTFVIAALIGGCGVKGPLLAPEDVKPERIRALKAGPDKDGIRLTWERPESYATGRTMRDLAGFAILRAQGRAPLAPIAELPIADRERFQKTREFDWVDTTTAMGQSYRYSVIALTDGGYQSDPSNVVEFVRILPPPPPNPTHFALPTPGAPP